MNLEKDIEKLARLKSAEINKALGLFILAFGFVVIFATFFTDTFVGQMTNLIAGFILASIGGGMMLKAKATIKKFKHG